MKTGYEERGSTAQKQPDTNIFHHEIEALVRCLLLEIQKFFDPPPEGGESLRNGRHRGQRKQRRKGPYDKSIGIMSEPMLLLTYEL